MSLCGPAAASGSTARPPGTHDNLASLKGKPPCKEKGDISSLEEKFLFGSLLASATNDRCADAKEDVCYAMLKAILTADAHMDHHSKSGPAPLGWRELHGEEYDDYLDLPDPRYNNDNMMCTGPRFNQGHWAHADNNNDSIHEDALYHHRHDRLEDEWEDDLLSWSDEPDMMEMLPNQQCRSFDRAQTTKGTPPRTYSSIGDFGRPRTKKEAKPLLGNPTV